MEIFLQVETSRYPPPPAGFVLAESENIIFIDILFKHLKLFLRNIISFQSIDLTVVGSGFVLMGQSYGPWIVTNRFCLKVCKLLTLYLMFDIC